MVRTRGACDRRDHLTDAGGLSVSKNLRMLRVARGLLRDHRQRDVGAFRQEIIGLQIDLMPFGARIDHVVFAVGERIRSAENERGAHVVVHVQVVVLQMQMRTVEIIVADIGEKRCKLRGADRIETARAKDALLARVRGRMQRALREDQQRRRVVVRNRAVRIGRAERVVVLRVDHAPLQRSVFVTGAEAICVVVGEAGGIAEAVFGRGLQPAIVGCHVLHRVLYANVVIAVVVVADVHAVARDDHRAHVIVHCVVLTAEGQRTVGFAGESDERLPAKFAAVLRRGAGHHVEAVLQLEDRARAAAQVLDALQTPAWVLIGARECLPRVLAALIGRITDARRNQAIQRHAALRMGNAGERAGDRERGELE